MARAMWKGVIRFGDVHVPVSLYSAVEEQGIHFRLLHASDRVPVEQKMIHPLTEEPVPSQAIQYGLEENDKIVVLRRTELAQLEPKESRDIVVHRFLPLGALDRRWYVRPYWLGPDTSPESYAALVEALGTSGREGVVTWTMRKEEYTGALRVRDGFLMLITLRPGSDLAAAAELEVPQGRGLTQPERSMAVQLVTALTGTFDPGAWRDEYRERVLELVGAKASGKVVPLPRYRPKRRPESLTEALEASVEAAKRGETRARREASGESEADVEPSDERPAQRPRRRTAS